VEAAPIFFRGFQLSVAHSLPQRFQFLLHSLHRLFGLVAVHHKHPRAATWPQATSSTAVCGTCDFSPALFYFVPNENREIGLPRLIPLGLPTGALVKSANMRL